MYVARLGPLLVPSTFSPNSAVALIGLSQDWFRDDPFLVSYVFRSIFSDLSDRSWDDEQGVPTAEFKRFVSDVLPHLNAILNALPAVSVDSLDALVMAHRDFISK